MEALLVVLLLATCCGLPLLLLGAGSMLQRSRERRPYARHETTPHALDEFKNLVKDSRQEEEARARGEKSHQQE